MPLKLLKKPPPTTVSHRVKLPDSRGRAWERRGERKRKQDGLSHHHPHPQLQHKILNIICNNIVTAFFSCSVVWAWVVNPGAASDNKFIWQPRGKHNPWAKRRSFIPLTETKTREMLHLVSCSSSQHSPYFQQLFSGNWPDEHNNHCLIVSQQDSGQLTQAEIHFQQQLLSNANSFNPILCLCIHVFIIGTGLDWAQDHNCVQPMVLWTILGGAE